VNLHNAYAFFIASLLLAPLHLAHAEETPYQEVAIDPYRIPWGIPTRDIWKQTALTHYAYTLEQECYCPLPAKSRVYIENNKVFAVKDLVTNRWLGKNKEIKYFKTINQLFDFIDESISKKPDSLRVVLDKHFGYPKIVEINPRYRIADDEINFKVSNLKQLEKIVE
jgi:hypothetical protein